MDENIKNKSGIYKIVNLANGKIYIGSSTKFITRFGIHIRLLRRNKHHSKFLQNSFNKYGEDFFKFEILEIVEDITNLISREQYYIDKFHPEYNMAKVAGSTLGMRHKKRKMSESHKINIGLALRGKKHADYRNRVNSLSHINKGGKRIDQFDKDNNFLRSWISISSIYKELGYDRSGIGECCRNKLKTSAGYVWKYAS